MSRSACMPVPICPPTRLPLEKRVHIAQPGPRRVALFWLESSRRSVSSAVTLAVSSCLSCDAFIDFSNSGLYSDLPEG